MILFTYNLFGNIERTAYNEDCRVYVTLFKLFFIKYSMLLQNIYVLDNDIIGEQVKIEIVSV